MQSRRAVLSVSGTALAVALAGCSGDDDQQDGESNGDESTNGDESSGGDDGGDNTGSDSNAPQINFDYSETPAQSDAGGTVTIAVTGGDEFEAGHVEITGENVVTEGTWDELDVEVDGDDSISAGDSLLIQVNDIEDYEIKITWSLPETDPEVVGETSN